ncbi:MAG: histidine kinase [Gaiellales bacterium]
MAAITLTGDYADDPGAVAVAALLVGWSFLASGLVLWQKRPDNRSGPLMVAIGFAWLATFLVQSDSALLFTVGTAVENVDLIGILYLLLSFPSGRLASVVDRALVAVAIVLGVVVELLFLLLGPATTFCGDCPRNVLQVLDAPTAASALLDGQRVVGAGFALVTAGRLALRWARASAPERRSAAPVLLAGCGVLAALACSAINDALGAPLGDAPAWVLFIAVATLPIGVLAVLAQQRLARGAVAGLVVDLGAGATPGDVREPLARALGDPSLELVFWVPDTGSYVDREGAPRRLPTADARRTATLVEREGQPVAALIHDRALDHNPELVRSVASAASLAIDNERLHAELRARLADLRASRARLVEAGEQERRRLERNLHDGAQQRLTSIAMLLGLAEAKSVNEPAEVRPLIVEARSALASAVAELRELSQGIHPSVLAERGLELALDELARSCALPALVSGTIGRRLPEGVEGAAYFVVSESLANAVKHAHANTISIAVGLGDGLLRLTVSDDGIGGADTGAGTGLRGLVDRVEALGGRLTVSSPPGRGTTITMELPCAS